MATKDLTATRAAPRAARHDTVASNESRLDVLSDLQNQADELHAKTVIICGAGFENFDLWEDRIKNDYLLNLSRHAREIREKLSALQQPGQDARARQPKEMEHGYLSLDQVNELNKVLAQAIAICSLASMHEQVADDMFDEKTLRNAMWGVRDLLALARDVIASD